MIRIIDIHTHILPGFDDGCRDLEETLAIVETARTQGILGVIATPHYSRRSSRTDWKEQQMSAIDQVNKALGENYILATGNETFWHEDLAERLEGGYGLPLAESRYVLMEYDPFIDYGTLLRSVSSLENCGYIPVLAHIERYGCLRENGRLEEVLSRGAKLQMNIGSLSGGLLDPDVRWCRKAVQEGKIHFLATDMHRPSFRPPEIRRATVWLEKKLGTEEAERMTCRNPRHVLAKENLE